MPMDNPSAGSHTVVRLRVLGPKDSCKQTPLIPVQKKALQVYKFHD